MENVELASKQSSPYTIHYEMTETEKGYEFRHFYTKESYVIPKDKNSKIRACYANEELICVLNTKGNVKVYLIKEDVLLDLGNKYFEDMEEIICMYGLGEGAFLIVGGEKGELVGYVLKIV